MSARWTFGAAILAVPLLGCDGVLDLRGAMNDPDAGVGARGAGTGRGGTGGGIAGRGGSVGTGRIVGRGGGPAGAPGRGGIGGGPPIGGSGGSIGSCANGLVAYYPLDNDVKDHSGLGHDLLATDVAPAPGVAGNGLAFNGTTSALRVAGGADGTLGDRSLCAWVKPDSVAGLAQPVFAGGMPGQGNIFSLTSSTPAAGSCMGSTEGEIFVEHWGMPCTVGSGRVAPSGQWSFVCYLFTGSTTEPLFVGSTYFLASGSNYPFPLSTLTIGSNGIGGTTTRPSFSGVIDEVTIWNYAISPTEENALMANGAALNCGSSTCNALPMVILTPGMSMPVMAGTTVQFDLAVTNTNNPASCPTDTFQYSSSPGGGVLRASPPSGQLGIPAGQTVHVPLQVVSSSAAPAGSYPLNYVVTDISSHSPTGSAVAYYVIGSTHVSTGIKLVPDGDGHFDGTNEAGVIGYWWSTGDDYGMDGTPDNGTCPMDGFSAAECSMLASPTPGMFFQPDAGGRGMCTSGVAAQVIADASGSPAYSSIWGNMIGFQINTPGPSDGGVAMRMPYDAPAHGITGFAFDIDAVPTGGHIRVTFQTVGTENSAAYWGGASGDASPIAGPGHYEMRWADIGGPMYATNPPPFDPTEIEAITFHVYSNAVAPVPYSFCINNVMLLTD